MPRRANAICPRGQAPPTPLQVECRRGEWLDLKTRRANAICPRGQAPPTPLQVECRRRFMSGGRMPFAPTECCILFAIRYSLDLKL